MPTPKDWSRPPVSPADRAALNGHQGAVIWFTGLSGSGKTTLARWLEHRLHQRRVHTFLLDGDAVRRRLNADLGFSAADRRENLRRVSEVASLFADAGIVVLVAAITPYETAREEARTRVGASRFILVHVATPLEVCEARDTKGLYARARAGELRDFTGIDSPYEEPVHCDLRVTTEDADSHADPDAVADRVVELLESRGLI